MKAFFIHDKNKQTDMMVIPESDCIVPMDRAVMETFISVSPDFSAYTGECLNCLPPEAFGQVVATRDTDGDVCIMDGTLWHQRMAHYLDANS